MGGCGTCVYLWLIKEISGSNSFDFGDVPGKFSHGVRVNYMMRFLLGFFLQSEYVRFFGDGGVVWVMMLTLWCVWFTKLLCLDGLGNNNKREILGKDVIMNDCSSFLS